MRRASSNASSSLRVASESACAKRSFAARSTSSARRLRSPSSGPVWRSALVSGVASWSTRADWASSEACCCAAASRAPAAALASSSCFVACRSASARRSAAVRRASSRRAALACSVSSRRSRIRRATSSSTAARRDAAAASACATRSAATASASCDAFGPFRLQPLEVFERVAFRFDVPVRGEHVALGLQLRLEGSDLREPRLRQRRQPLALLTSAGDRGLALITGRRGGGELAVHPISESLRFLEVTICPFPGFRRRLVLDGRLLVKPFGCGGQRPGGALGTLLRVALRDVTDLRRVGLRRRQQALALLERLVQQLSPEGLVTGVDRVPHLWISLRRCSQASRLLGQQGPDEDQTRTRTRTRRGPSPTTGRGRW